MLKQLLQTDCNNTAALVARLFLGFIILPHGLQKTVGAFGGYGFSPTVDFFVQSGIPAPVAILIILGESVGAIMLILGLISRFAAFGISLIMLGAIFMVHLEHGFFMNWFGTQQGEGFEYHLAVLGLGIVVMLAGGGRWSVDNYIVDSYCSK